MPARTFAFFHRSLLQPVLRTLARGRVLWMILLAALMLTGCVQYDVEININSANQGEILQHIRLDERLTAFSNESAQQWLDSIDRRTRNLDGKVHRISDRELLVSIPFSSGTELETKFNEFFQPSVSTTQPPNAASLDLPNLASQVHFTQYNFFLVQRAKLSYDLDLSALGILAADGNLLIGPSSLLDLTFRLNTPWGAKNLVVQGDRSTRTGNPTSSKPTAVQKEGRYLVWTLKPGQPNHVEAAFWLPNPLGIGTLIIALLVLVGSFLKYQRLSVSN
jgi:hypothetical protein